MKTKYAVLSSLFFIIQLVGVLPLRAEHYYFKQISLKEGLPSNVRCILRDEQGFVWIGTKSGLGKFDGHELKRYKHQANDPNSLLHNLVYQIAEDKQHNICTDRKRYCPLPTAEQRLHVPHGRGREEYHRLFLLPCPGRNPLWRQGQDLQI